MTAAPPTSSSWSVGRPGRVTPGTSLGTVWGWQPPLQRVPVSGRVHVGPSVPIRCGTHRRVTGPLPTLLPWKPDAGGWSDAELFSGADFVLLGQLALCADILWSLLGGAWHSTGTWWAEVRDVEMPLSARDDPPRPSPRVLRPQRPQGRAGETPSDAPWRRFVGGGACSSHLSPRCGAEWGSVRARLQLSLVPTHRRGGEDARNWGWETGRRELQPDRPPRAELHPRHC